MSTGPAARRQGRPRHARGPGRQGGRRLPRCAGHPGAEPPGRPWRSTSAPDMSVNALCVMDLGASAYTGGRPGPAAARRRAGRRRGGQELSPHAPRGPARGRERALGAVQHPGCPALEAAQARTRTARTSPATSRACSPASTGSTWPSRCPATARARSPSSCRDTAILRTHRGRASPTDRAAVTGPTRRARGRGGPGRRSRRLRPGRARGPRPWWAGRPTRAWRRRRRTSRARPPAGPPGAGPGRPGRGRGRPPGRASSRAPGR